MKKSIILLLALCSAMNSIVASIPIFPLFTITEKTSVSFMEVRPAYFNVSAQQSMWHRYAFGPCVGKNAFQFIPFYNKSDKESDIARYFLLNCQVNPSVKGDAVTENKFERDIRAEWLGLPSTFNNEFTIRPHQRQVGLFAEYKLNLCDVVPWNFMRNMFVGGTLIYNDVENKIEFSETTTALTSTNTIRSALTNESWSGGRFVDTQQQGFSEIRFSIGTRFIQCMDWEFDYQTYVSVPLMTPKSNANIFPAYVGFNGHTGWGNIVHMQMPISPRCSNFLRTFFIDLENVLLFQRKQCRIFDLIDKQWSRYLLFNNLDGRRNIPGPNVLTLQAKIRPYNQVNIAMGVRGTLCGCELEGGYGLWAHGKEKVELKKKFPSTFGIAGNGNIITIDDIEVGATASNSTISFLADNDTSDGADAFVTITQDDIDLDSAASRSTYAHRGFINLGVSGCTRYTRAFAAFGIYAESPHKNTALFNWGWWIKGGAAF